MRNVAEIAEAFAKSQATYNDHTYALKLSTPSVPYHAPYTPRPEIAAIRELTQPVIYVKDLVGKFVV